MRREVSAVQDIQIKKMYLVEFGNETGIVFERAQYEGVILLVDLEDGLHVQLRVLHLQITMLNIIWFLS